MKRRNFIELSMLASAVTFLVSGCKSTLVDSMLKDHSQIPIIYRTIKIYS